MAKIPIPNDTTRLPLDVQKKFCENPSQSRVGKDYFITGAAGTGKSYYINNVLKQDLFGDSTVVTSSTGVSAILVGGFTLHSFFKIGIASSLEDLKIRDSNLKDKNPQMYFQMLSKLKKNLKTIKRIVIDEVSMVPKDLLDCVFHRLQQCEGDHIQLVYSGDLLQLPPVKGSTILSHPEFIGLDVKYMTKIYRTKNEEFARKLSEIRLGDVDLEYLKQFVVDEPISDPSYTFLVSTNKEAKYKNALEYNKITEGEFDYDIKVSEGRFYPSENELRTTIQNLRVDETLKLKVGTRVMNTVNIGRLVNGDVGTVVSLTEHNILVKFDRLDKPELVTYHRYDKETMIDGKIHIDYSVRYIPLIYAWAITIHKSQGMSIDKLYIDVRNIFAPSQFYVAISRATTPETTKIYCGVEGADVLHEYLPKLKRVLEVSKDYYTLLQAQTK